MADYALPGNGSHLGMDDKKISSEFPKSHDIAIHLIFHALCRQRAACWGGWFGETADEGFIAINYCLATNKT